MKVVKVWAIFFFCCITAWGQKPIDQTFIIENYYKVKWGYAEEFLELYKRNHYPLLKKAIEKGDVISITLEKPRQHAAEESRWDYRITLVFKNKDAAFNPNLTEPYKKSLYPDLEKLKKEEQRRFEILLAHWDVEVQTLDLEKQNGLDSMARILPLKEELTPTETKIAYNQHQAIYNSITNMKSTLGHSFNAFQAYMQWSPLYEDVKVILGKRLAPLFAWSISEASDCPLCSTYFRKIIIESGEDPENLELSDDEKRVLSFGAAIAGRKGFVRDEIFEPIYQKFQDKEIVC